MKGRGPQIICPDDGPGGSRAETPAGVGDSQIYFKEFSVNNLNSIIIEGTLIDDPKYRETPRGTAVCTFSIANDRYYKRNDGIEKEVSFFDIEAWAKLAESVKRLGYKGRGIKAVGRLKQERWDGTDGKPHTRIIIVAEHLEFRRGLRQEAPLVESAELDFQEDSEELEA
jgi:single-strand DNA-binding protein